MPHVPRSTPPTSGTPPEFIPRPPDAEPDPPADEAAAARPARRVGLGTLSPHTYTPDRKQLMLSLFGTEPEVDERTRELVFRKRVDVGRPADGDRR